MNSKQKKKFMFQLSGLQGICVQAEFTYLLQAGQKERLSSLLGCFASESFEKSHLFCKKMFNLQGLVCAQLL